MADERQDEREATFKFIEEVHNCPAVWDVSSAAYKDTKNKQKKMEELLDERVVRPNRAVHSGGQGGQLPPPGKPNVFFPT